MFDCPPWNHKNHNYTYMCTKLVKCTIWTQKPVLCKIHCLKLKFGHSLPTLVSVISPKSNFAQDHSYDFAQHHKLVKYVNLSPGNMIYTFFLFQETSNINTIHTSALRIRSQTWNRSMFNSHDCSCCFMSSAR